MLGGIPLPPGTYLSGTMRNMLTRIVFRDWCYCCLICAHYVYHRGGYVGYIRKALEKGYLPGSACCRDGMFEIFVLFGWCLCCLLPAFVNRQSLCPGIHSRHVLLHPQMHHRNLWFAKEHALGVLPGCRLVAWWPLAPQKGLAQVVHSNLHAPTPSTRFYPLLRPNSGWVPVKSHRLQDWQKLKKYVPNNKHGDVCPNGVP